MSLPLQIAAKKFQEILLGLAGARVQSSAIALTENDWQPKPLPYNV
jgi:hypothetical protein